MSIYAWGALGAIAPEVLRWRRIAFTGTPPEWKRRSYWLCTALYVGLAALFAALVAQPNPYAAFVAGTSAEFAILGAWSASTSGSTNADASAQEPASEIEELTSRPATVLDLAIQRGRKHAEYLRWHA